MRYNKEVFGNIIENMEVIYLFIISFKTLDIIMSVIILKLVFYEYSPGRNLRGQAAEIWNFFIPRELW